MTVTQDEDGNLVISMNGLEIKIPASEVLHFSFSEGHSNPNGVDDLFMDPSSDAFGSSGEGRVNISYSGGILRMESNCAQSFDAVVYTLAGRKVRTFTGNPIEIHTGSFAPDTYILSTCNNSFKFTVR